MTAGTAKTNKSFAESELGFRAFLDRTADGWASTEAHKQQWIQYMMDGSRGESVVQNIVDFFGIQTNGENKALDIGCGFGNHLMALQKRFSKVCGVDIEEKCVEWSQKRVPDTEVVQTSATEIPWSDAEFDLVLSTDVFEHISYPEQEQAAAEIMRVMKPNGCGYVEVPNRLQILDEHNRVLFGTWLSDSLREKYSRLVSRKGSYTQCWERTGAGWKKLFEEQGFKVSIKPHYLKNLDFLKYLFIPPNRYHIYLVKP